MIIPAKGIESIFYRLIEEWLKPVWLIQEKLIKYELFLMK